MLFRSVLVEQEWPDFDTVDYSKNVPGHNQNRKIYDPINPDGLAFWHEYYKNIIDHQNIRDAVYSLEGLNDKIGRASCRERVQISVVDVSLKKKKK